MPIMTNELTPESYEFKQGAQRLAARIDDLATLTSIELGRTVPRALEVITILLVGVLKAHGFRKEDIMKTVVSSYDEIIVTVKTPFIGKGGSA